MDVATTTTTASTNNTHTNHNNNTSTPPTAKSPDQETETPTTRIHPPKPLSFTNGVLKRQHHHHHHHHHHPVVISYKECLKNHAASLGGHALDGCGEFMPSPSAVHTDPTSLKCAACGCHRNFHRREPEDSPNSPHRHPSLISNATTTIEYQPHNRHHPPPPPPATVAQQPYRSPNSASPPPISSSYPSSAPHMLLALSGGASGLNESTGLVMGSGGNSSSRKRFRTKFSQLQKDKMYKFSERVGWKMQKRDEEIIQEFCNEIGVDKGVLKVWMHNNKNTFGKKDGTPNGNGNENGNNGSGGSINLDQNNNSSVENVNRHRHNHHHLFENHDSVVTHHVGTNGSSSSS